MNWPMIKMCGIDMYSSHSGIDSGKVFNKNDKVYKAQDIRTYMTFKKKKKGFHRGLLCPAS